MPAKQPKNWDDLTREEKMKCEQRRLSAVLKEIPKDRAKLCDRLIGRAAFLYLTLLDYETEIASSGILQEMPQGDYSITRENPALRGYNTTVKNYASVIKQLCDLLPDRDEGKATAGAALLAFNRK